MSDQEIAAAKVREWLQPLADAAAPCGPDLEYDNDFLALNQAAAGKPESQFAAAEPPEWRRAFELAAELLDRSRDLRIAVLWLRAGLHTQGFAFLPVGLSLLAGLLDQLWDHVHPLPDPDDGDPYARVNALALLSAPEGVLGDLRSTPVFRHRAVGELSMRALEVALGVAPARADETDVGRDHVTQMMAAALAQLPELREQATQAQALMSALAARADERLGAGTAPDLTPLTALIGATVAALPIEAAGVAGDDATGAMAGEGAAPASAAARQGLSGQISTREEAVRAIDMVCAYLEHAEPSSPAPLFLRRARHLISHNFLQLMKELAPDALNEVARIVGVDPESVQTPDAP